MTDADPPIGRDLLERILRDSSTIAMRRFRQSAPEGTQTRKADLSPLTITDREIADYLRERLRLALPHAAWLCEEDQDDLARLDSDFVWIVDPLDGTREFISGVPEIAISVGLVRCGEPVAAGVVNPPTGEWGVWTAWEGARFSDNPGVRTDTPVDLACAAICVSRTEFDKGLFGPLGGAIREIRPVGSVAYKLLRVASHRDDLYVSFEPKSEWDVCGGFGLLVARRLTYRRLDNVAIRFNQRETRIRSGAVAGPSTLVDAFLHQCRDAIVSAQTAIKEGRIR